MTEQPSQIDLTPVKQYFTDTLSRHGPTPGGVDYNSYRSMEIRFEQILKVCDTSRPFSVLDYGCGFGALAGYLRQQPYDFVYTGFDIVETMVAEAVQIYPQKDQFRFFARRDELGTFDYVVESGIFNMRLDADYEAWTDYVIETLHDFDRFSTRGFSFNLLTSYSDEEYKQKRRDLYYADPCFYFDYCKKHFSRNVALLHDYELYDFTILVRKDAGSTGK